MSNTKEMPRFALTEDLLMTNGNEGQRKYPKGTTFVGEISDFTLLVKQGNESGLEVPLEKLVLKNYETVKIENDKAVNSLRNPDKTQKINFNAEGKPNIKNYKILGSLPIMGGIGVTCAIAYKVYKPEANTFKTVIIGLVVGLVVASMFSKPNTIKVLQDGKTDKN